MKGSVSERLLNTGILQFGYFVDEGTVAPVRFCPEYLPAYPDLLTEIAKLAVFQFDTSKVDHLIVMADSLPLGLASSLQTGLSLVYSRGRRESPVYDLVGSYNSGHMSVFILNCIADVAASEKFIASARSVGLETKSIVAFLEMRGIKQLAGIPIHYVFRLVDIVQELIALGRLSDGQAQAIKDWLTSSS